MSTTDTARASAWALMTDHTARPRSWERIAEFAESQGDSCADGLMELRARVERLEQAQQQPAPSTPAGQGELVRSVALAIPGGSTHVDWTPEARRAIFAAADWLVSQGYGAAANTLRREVGR
jgi:hypothetical protein